MVLNELSLQTPAETIPTARKWMSEFLSTVRMAIGSGVSRAIRSHMDLHSIVIAPEYPIARWRNDGGVDLEERRFLRTLTSKFPLLVDLPELAKEIPGLECRFEGDEAHGLGVASLLEALPLSLLSEQRWDCSHLEVEITQLDEQGDLISEHVQIIHASQAYHVLEHAEWIKVRIRTSVHDGVDLWNRRRDLLPSLEFCDVVGEQMQHLHANHPVLRFVVRQLFELEHYCRGWHDGPFDPKQLPCKISPESEPTLQQFGRQRTFRCPDDVDRVFSWHVKINQAAWRIHFRHEEGPGKIIIGYVGPHLPTVKDPT